ncbi:MAG: hypothetical protein ACSLFD_12175 [Solirubrobacterales bacterium]
MSVVFALILLVAVVAFVSYPFWGKGDSSTTEDPEVAGLEAARESKYREIRDAETDLASGKLSQEDFDLVNNELRGDAVEILKKLDQAETGDKEDADTDQSPSGGAGS